MGEMFIVSGKGIEPYWGTWHLIGGLDNNLETM